MLVEWSKNKYWFLVYYLFLTMHKNQGPNNTTSRNVTAAVATGGHVSSNILDEQLTVDRDENQSASDLSSFGNNNFLNGADNSMNRNSSPGCLQPGLSAKSIFNSGAGEKVTFLWRSFKKLLICAWVFLLGIFHWLVISWNNYLLKIIKLSILWRLNKICEIAVS